LGRGVEGNKGKGRRIFAEKYSMNGGEKIFLAGT